MKRCYTAIGVLSLLLLLILALTRVSAQATPLVTGVEPLPDRYPSALQASDVITVCPASVGVCPYTDVQAAVDAASDGDLVKVAAGTYTGVQGRPAPPDYPLPPPSGIVTQVVYISKTITIRGGYTTTNGFADPPDSTANPTTLDAQKQGRVLYITSSISPIVEGLYLINGDAAGQGGGSGWDDDAGGGVYVISATATIKGCQITGNTARAGGGVYLHVSDATLDDNTISANGASSGAGLYLYRSGATLNDNTISANTGTNGGGLYLYYSAATLSNNTVTANQAASGGGLLLSYSDATLNGNTVTSNTNVMLAGGGLSLYNSNAMLNGNLISGNTVRCFGGGLSLSYSNATLSGNTISANTAHINGGGLSLSDSDAMLVNNVIADNTGSGLYIESHSPHLLHTTIAGNSGPGIYNASPVSVALTNTILVSHTVGIYISSGSIVRLEGTLWYSNTDDWDGGGTVGHNNDHTGPPAFVDPDAGDYHIGPASTARDAGIDAGVTEDIDGHPRPIGPGFDLGADEYTGVDLSPSSKNASPEEARAGDVVTFTIVLFNNGIWNASDTTLYDSIPTSTTYISGSARATSGVLTDAGGIRWTGTVTPSETITIAFQVVVGEEVFIKNTAIVTDEYGAVVNLVAWVNPQRLYLPLMLRGFQAFSACSR